MHTNQSSMNAYGRQSILTAIQTLKRHVKIDGKRYKVIGVREGKLVTK